MRTRRKVKRMRTMKGGFISKPEWLQGKNDPAGFQNVTNAMDQFQIGSYYKRYDNPPNLTEANKWFTKSAEQNNILALMDLIEYYEASDDDDALIQWLNKAVYGYDRPDPNNANKLGDVLVKSAMKAYITSLNLYKVNSSDPMASVKALKSLSYLAPFIDKVFIK